MQKIKQINIIKVINLLIYLFLLVRLVINMNILVTRKNQIPSIIFAVMITIVENWILFFFIIASKIINKAVKIERLEEIDFSKTKDYYRDIIKGYSISELVYIDNFEISYPRTIIAEILQLEKGNKLKIENGKIEICGNIDLTELNHTQTYIIEHIEEGKLRNIEKNEIENKIREDAIEHDLIKNQLMINYKMLNNKNKAESSTKNRIIYVTSIIIFISIIFVLSPIMAIFIIAYILAFIKNPYVRTKKGKEINIKIEGIKKYLEDYSLLDKKGQEELVIWEDYLIYSVAFGQNNKIVKEYEKCIEV